MGDAQETILHVQLQQFDRMDDEGSVGLMIVDRVKAKAGLDGKNGVGESWSRA
jgi:hypothetical protein